MVVTQNGDCQGTLVPLTVGLGNFTYVDAAFQASHVLCLDWKCTGAVLNLTAAEVVLDGELCSKPPQWLAESDDSGFTIAFLIF